MWNDEDNNPYGSFDAEEAAIAESFSTSARATPYEPPSTPPSNHSSPSQTTLATESHQEQQRNNEAEQAEAEGGAYDGNRLSLAYRAKPRMYRSRIEQMLEDNPDMPIQITDAGKNHEGSGSFIVYTIQTGDLEVRRRYSEFSSLRATLVNLHPTLIVPPIPEKHTMADYAAKPTKAKEDSGIIEQRKRMLCVFLNRCRRMKEIREDGVWWKFLDPNASWSEVLHSPPASNVPKNNLKAPPLDPANPKQAHSWLPIPSSSAKLKTGSTGLPSSPEVGASPSKTAPGNQFLNRFPPSTHNLSEQELDPYFSNFESSTRELEILLQGNIEKVNRRTISHLDSLSSDLMELGARYNGFSLQQNMAPTLAAALERVGQAADTSYLATAELTANLGATFAEPMRESAQFASIVRSVLRYRVLKRIQEDMTRDELSKKKALLDQLERSELEAKRLERVLNRSSSTSSAASPSSTRQTKLQRSASESSVPPITEQTSDGAPTAADDSASIDSDFPPTHGENRHPSADQGRPALSEQTATAHRKSPSGSFAANKLFGRITHAYHGLVDADPERSRRDQIGKTKESLIQLEQALQVSETDVKDASTGVLQDLKRFQGEKEDDLRRYMVAYARCHLDWARRNLETWTEAKEEVDKIDVRPTQEGKY